MTVTPKIMPFEILKDGLKLTKNNFLAYFPLIAILAVVVFIASNSIEQSLLAQGSETSLLDTLSLTSVIASILLSPLEIGLMLLGLSAARTETIALADLRHVLPYTIKIIAITIVTMIVVQAGFMLLLIPGLFLSLLLSMAPMLMCDKQLGIFAALKLSAEATSKQWFRLLSVYIWLMVMILLSFYTMGIALVFTIPLYMNVKGLLYRQLFDGVGADTIEPTIDNDDFKA